MGFPQDTTVAMLILTLAVLLSIARADVPELVLESMKNKQVEVVLAEDNAVFGSLMGFDESSLVLVQPGGDILTVPRASIVKLKGVDTATAASPDAEASPTLGGPAVVRSSDFTIVYEGAHEQAMVAAAQAVEACGGTVKKSSSEKGLVEGAWKYGLNAFGLRVTINVTPLPGGKVQLNFRGHFKDAFSTVNAPKVKADEVLVATMGFLGR